MEYPSIENLYNSNEENGPGRRRGPEFGVRAPGAEQVDRWLVTEKVDGTNIRVILIGPTPAKPDATLRIAGRTDNAQLHPDLIKYLNETFTMENLVNAFRDETDQIPDEVILFGEGFGPGIQKAGVSYGGEKRFILFDVKVGNWWLTWDNVVDVAEKLGVPHVPVLAYHATTEEAKALVRCSELLGDGHEHVEGIVARTDPYLFDRRGHRVMFKYKVRDLPSVTYHNGYEPLHA